MDFLKMLNNLEKEVNKTKKMSNFENLFKEIKKDDKNADNSDGDIDSYFSFEDN